MICWLAVRKPTVEDGYERHLVSSKFLYTPKLLQCLRDIETPDIAADTTPDEAAFALRGFSDHVMALVVLKPKCCPDVWSQLSALETCMLEYNYVTKYGECPFMICQVTAGRSFEPVPLYSTLGTRKSARSLWTRSSAGTIAACGLEMGLNPAELLAATQASQRFNGLQVTATIPNETLLVPPPYGWLVACDALRSVGFPLCSGPQARGTRIGIARPLWQHVDGAARAAALTRAAGRLGDVREISMETLANLSASFRSCVSDQPVGADVRRNIEDHLRWLHGIQMSMLVASVRRTWRIHSMSNLVNTVIASGWLREVRGLKQVFLSALRTIITEPEILAHYTKLLDDPKSKAVASRATLYRHRLTIHMGYCLQRQAQLSEMLESPGGITCWRTMDLSPQGGTEWVMAGVSYMKQEDLRRALLASFLLCRPRDPDDEPDEELEDANRLLRKLLHLEQGAPTGVGSGRKDLKHKIHAWTHSEKLTAPSWKAAAKSMCSTFAIVGGLGEASVVTFRSELPRLFGDWVLTSDGYQADFLFGAEVPDAESAGSDSDFVFAAGPPLGLEDNAVVGDVRDVPDFPTCSEDILKYEKEELILILVFVLILVLILKYWGGGPRWKIHWVYVNDIKTFPSLTFKM